MQVSRKVFEWKKVIFYQFMSLWGATVITNLFGAIPLVGDNILILLWGGFSVDNPTLKRFFALHFLLRVPFYYNEKKKKVFFL